MDGNTPIEAKGAAQHSPFMAFALVGHFILFFIRVRTETITLRNFRKFAPNITPKLASQIRTMAPIGELYLAATSLRTVPMTMATDMAIKSSPNALFASTACESLCTNEEIR